MMKTIVTGGAGFIGSHVAETLLADGHSVLVLDNLATGKLENISHLRSNRNFHFHRVDIRKADSIGAFFRGVDWVFHLAALAAVVPSINRPLEYISTNVNGTVNVLEASRLHGVKRFVYAASSSCYGIPAQIPTTEQAPLDIRHPYALTKYTGETCALHWERVYRLPVYRLPVISFRLFNVYGLRSHSQGTYGSVLGIFLAQKLAGKPFTVVGDGLQTRDFVCVTDVARAFLSAAKSAISGEIFNVGSGNSYSVNDLARLLGGAVVHLPKRPGEPDASRADISKIRMMLKWKPEITFESGIRTVLEHIGEWKSAPVRTPKSIGRLMKHWIDANG
jgi:UDP-glucose 4-epimerase